MVTQQQHDEFVRTGLVTVPDALSQHDVRQIRADIWAYLRLEYGVDEHDRRTWPEIRIPTFKGLSRSDAFASVGDGPVPAALDEIMGVGWQPPKAWAGGPMVTFPMPGTTWDVPSGGWHFDRPFDPVDRPGAPGVNVFIFVEQVRPRGAGTVVLAGSHQLVDQHATASPGTLHARELKRVLRAEDRWLDSLFDPTDQSDRIRRFMHDGARIGDVDLQVVELTGEPGDAILMDARTLHTIGPNSLDTPRVMLNQLISR